MSFAEGDSVFNAQSVHRVIELMQQMVCRYLNLNIPSRSLRFYAPVYFINQLALYYTHGQLEGLTMCREQLAVWGVEVHIGYENTVVLFCPEHVPASYSPVLSLSHLGFGDMEVVCRY